MPFLTSLLRRLADVFAGHKLLQTHSPACVCVAPACPSEFRPVQRELVIDIDISDYDELRTCGSGGHICSKCWPFMAVAVQVGAQLCHCGPTSNYCLV